MQGGSKWGRRSEDVWWIRFVTEPLFKRLLNVALWSECGECFPCKQVDCYFLIQKHLQHQQHRRPDFIVSTVHSTCVCFVHDERYHWRFCTKNNDQDWHTVASRDVRKYHCPWVCSIMFSDTVSIITATYSLAYGIILFLIIIVLHPLYHDVYHTTRLLPIHVPRGLTCILDPFTFCMLSCVMDLIWNA